MAKQVETHNRFRIYIEVEAEELGVRLVQLANLDLKISSPELITDVIAYKKNPPRIAHETTGDEFAREWVKEHPTFRALELVQHFRGVERTAGSAYTALRNMVDQKIVVKVSPGNYARADVKALEAPKEPSQRGKHGKTPQAVSNWDLIRNAMKHRKRITSMELRALFKEEGRNENSVSPILAKMRAAKVIKDISPGEYEILKPPVGKRDAAKAKLNGVTPSSTTETTHG